jgi:hypothetical protein
MSEHRHLALIVGAGIGVMAAGFYLGGYQDPIGIFPVASAIRLRIIGASARRGDSGYRLLLRGRIKLRRHRRPVFFYWA